MGQIAKRYYKLFEFGSLVGILNDLAVFPLKIVMIAPDLTILRILKRNQKNLFKNGTDHNNTLLD